MEVTVENIGKIKTAKIPLNGITVLAGDNDSGKSTISKCLSTCYDLCLRKEEFINKFLDSHFFEIKKGIFSHRLMESEYPLDQGFEDSVNHELSAWLKDIKNEQQLPEEQEFKDKITNIIFSENEYIKDNHIYIKIGNLTNKYEKFKKFLKLKKKIMEDNNYEQEILGTYFSNLLNTNFNDQINNIYNNEIAKICVNSEELQLNAEIVDNKISKFSFNTLKEYLKPSIYISDLSSYIKPSDLYLPGEPKCSNSTVSKLIDQIFFYKFSPKKVYENELFSFIDFEDTYYLSFNDHKLDTRNLSPGLRSFANIKNLLQKGVFNNCGICILDEPEVHLNPKWQVKLAEILVLLKKEFDFKLFINTHSPYFVCALETYSERENLSSSISYCIIEQQDAFSSNVKSDDQTLSQIYSMLAYPMQQLEDLKYE